jgi:hypothetical protein
MKIKVFYLNTGVGNACAGHSIDIDCPASFLKINPSPMLTLGLTDPIGSIRDKESLFANDHFQEVCTPI